MHSFTPSKIKNLKDIHHGLTKGHIFKTIEKPKSKNFYNSKILDSLKIGLIMNSELPNSSQKELLYRAEEIYFDFILKNTDRDTIFNAIFPDEDEDNYRILKIKYVWIL